MLRCMFRIRVSRRLEFGTDLSADLVRRDFTINAMAAALPSGEVVDLFGGVEDLRAGVLRTRARRRSLFLRIRYV